MVLLGSSFCFGLANLMLNLDFPFPGYFIRIPFPWHDHVCTQCFMDYFMANIAEMLMHARAIGTRSLFPAWVRGYWGC